MAAGETLHLKMFGRDRSTGLFFKVFNIFPIKWSLCIVFNRISIISTDYYRLLGNAIYTERGYNCSSVSEPDNDSSAVMMYLIS